MPRGIAPYGQDNPGKAWENQGDTPAWLPL
jgi:hypothetical protein